MRLVLAIIFRAILAGIVLSTGCATQTKSKMDRSQLIDNLHQEMLANSGWVRVHAAEGLLDNGQCVGEVAKLFREEARNSSALYRTGVWRVLARSTSSDERAGYIQRIRQAMYDPQASDRISAGDFSSPNARVRFARTSFR